MTRKCVELWCPVKMRHVLSSGCHIEFSISEDYKESEVKCIHFCLG